MVCNFSYQLMPELQVTYFKGFEGLPSLRHLTTPPPPLLAFSVKSQWEAHLIY